MHLRLCTGGTLSLDPRPALDTLEINYLFSYSLPTSACFMGFPILPTIQIALFYPLWYLKTLFSLYTTYTFIPLIKPCRFNTFFITPNECGLAYHFLHYIGRAMFNLFFMYFRRHRLNTHIFSSSCSLNRLLFFYRDGVCLQVTYSFTVSNYLTVLLFQ